MDRSSSRISSFSAIFVVGGAGGWVAKSLATSTESLHPERRPGPELFLFELVLMYSKEPRRHLVTVLLVRTALWSKTTWTRTVSPSLSWAHSQQKQLVEKGRSQLQGSTSRLGLTEAIRENWTKQISCVVPLNSGTDGMVHEPGDKLSSLARDWGRASDVRPEDIDLFSPEPGGPEAVVYVVRDALLQAGYEVDITRLPEAHGGEFARLGVTRGGQAMHVDMARDWRKWPTVQLQVGPVLHLNDAVSSKVNAMVGRWAPRDFHRQRFGDWPRNERASMKAVWFMRLSPRRNDEPKRARYGRPHF